MILIEGKKFACDTCIKGHRSSACKHTDRPLFEIQKKGRPITQCSHCRELRKTKQVHVKCQCGDGKGGKDESQLKSLKKVPEAVYPAGVSTTLQASIVLIPDPSSDSDQPGCSKSATCSCKAGGPCHCAVPRKSKRTRQKTSTNVPIPSNPLSQTTTRPHPDSAREYRPVLPKPSQHQIQNTHNHVGSLHASSRTSTHGHVVSHHAHPDVLYSPYGRAYESSHSYDRSYEENLGSIDFTRIENIAEANNIIFTDTNGQSIPWNVPNATGASQSLCGCGESCTCPGCYEHRGFDAAVQTLMGVSARTGCVNPNTCTSCVECSVIIGASADTSPPEIQCVDEWLRQLTTPSSLSSVGSQPLTYTIQQPTQANALPQYGDLYTASGSWIHKQFNGASECCSNRCKCPPGLCACASDCCGCCQDQDCACPRQGERGPLTFAVSGERDGCCNGRTEDNSSMDTAGTFLTLQIPDTDASFDESQRSRASSMSASEENRGRWDEMHFVPNPSPVKSCCSKERTASVASFYPPIDDMNIF